MVNINVKMKDVMDNLSSRISGHDLFDFDVSHIDRMRTEIYDVLSQFMTYCLISPEYIVITGYFRIQMQMVRLWTLRVKAKKTTMRTM